MVLGVKVRTPVSCKVKGLGQKDFKDGQRYPLTKLASLP